VCGSLNRPQPVCIDPWKKKFNQLPELTILGRFKNLTIGLIAKTSVFSSLQNFESFKVSGALPAE
jgi:hypothetical protein